MLVYIRWLIRTECSEAEAWAAISEGVSTYVFIVPTKRMHTHVSVQLQRSGHAMRTHCICKYCRIICTWRLIVSRVLFALRLAFHCHCPNDVRISLYIVTLPQVRNNTSRQYIECAPQSLYRRIISYSSNIVLNICMNKYVWKSCNTAFSLKLRKGTKYAF